VRGGRYTFNQLCELSLRRSYLNSGPGLGIRVLPATPPMAEQGEGADESSGEVDSHSLANKLSANLLQHAAHPQRSERVGSARAASSSVPFIGVETAPSRSSQRSREPEHLGEPREHSFHALPPSADVEHEAFSPELPRGIHQQTPPDGRGAARSNKWYRLPKQELTPSAKDDLRVLQLRNALDPKRFYKRPDSNKLPRRFQIGTIVEHPQDSRSGRLSRRERAPNITQEALRDERSRAFRKRKWKELQEESSKVLVPPKKKSILGKRKKGRSKL